MGYQESVITTADSRDFPKLYRRVIQLGESYYNSLGCEIGFIITAKKDMRTTEFYHISKGQRFLYAYGDRTAQYGTENFLNQYRPERRISEHGTRGGWDGENIEFDFQPVIIYRESLSKNFLAWGNPTERKPVIETAYVRVEQFKYADLTELNLDYKTINQKEI